MLLPISPKIPMTERIKGRIKIATPIIMIQSTVLIIKPPM